jgi:hypothetical protein
VSPLSFLGLTESIGDLYSVVAGVIAFALLFAFLRGLEHV